MQYSDPDFELPENINGIRIEWRRPGEIFPEGNSRLFGDSLTYSDVLQGSLGNCYVLSTIALLTTHPKSVYALFLSGLELRADGKYTFRFFQQGQWVQVTIDDRLPVRAKRHKITGKATYTLPFGHCKTIEHLWLPLLEKAVAKHYGSYDNLAGGNTSESLLDLTGAVVHDVNLADVLIKNSPLRKLTQTVKHGARRLLTTLRKDLQNGKLIATAKVVKTGKEKDPVDNQGVVQNHAYAIIRAFTVKGVKTKLDPGPVGVLLIRNPTARHEFKGMFHRNTAKQIPIELQGAPPQDLPPGCFYILLEEFLQKFNRLYVADREHSWEDPSAPTADTSDNEVKGASGFRQRIQDEWNSTTETAGGCNNFPSWRKNHMYRIYVPRREQAVRFNIILQQPDARVLRHTTNADAKINYHQTGITILSRTNLDEPSPFLPTERLLGLDYQFSTQPQNSFWNKRDAFSSILLLPGEEMELVLIPSTFYPDNEGQFSLCVFSEQPGITMEAWNGSSSTKFQQLTMKSKWSLKLGTAGGPASSHVFHKNRAYLMDLKHTGEDTQDSDRVVQVHVQLTQTPFASEAKKDNPNKAIGVYVLNQGKLGIDPQVMSNDRLLRKFKFKRESTVESVWTVKVSQFPILLVPATFHSREKGHYQLNVFIEKMTSTIATLSRWDPTLAEIPPLAKAVTAKAHGGQKHTTRRGANVGRAPSRRTKPTPKLPKPTSRKTALPKARNAALNMADLYANLE